MTSLLTRKQVAEMLGVSVRWLEENRADGPPYYQLGDRTVRYDEADVLNWLRQRRRTY
ncbi:hypothetical protein AUR04nite_00010 [Glutamicibacter uratoxydans]|uniref:Helix-turn-helix domain-containing protein n=1 Tax=Glutamicibacter uratoxydans TaxID=43667 RepID=A0A4Y4DGW9_GLUUR|nr:helix-turn-helix domain-containing protein [Glutamicibacter uratoxydans]GED04469.1 hypothetical protein AUR04nite_00010 [Glutamicibacter uratoxydans]